MTSNKILTEKYNQIVEGIPRETFIIPPIQSITAAPENDWRGWGTIIFCNTSAEYGTMMTDPFPDPEGFRNWLIRGPFKDSILGPNAPVTSTLMGVGLRLSGDFFAFFILRRNSVHSRGFIDCVKHACKETRKEVCEYHKQYLEYTQALNKDNPGIASDY